MRAMQCMPFRAKNANIYLKPTDFLKPNFYFEMEEVHGIESPPSEDVLEGNS